MDCPFCNPEIDKSQRIIFDSEYSLFLQTPQRVLVGSGVIVPKRHYETVFDLNQDEWNDIHQLLQKVKQYLDEQYKPDGYNVGWNCGSVGGQEIFHAHMHVIPRFANEPLAGKGIRHWLKQEENKRIEG